MNLGLTIFLKKKPGKTIFEIHRKDGSMTFAKIHPGMEYHELAHWVIESRLSLTNSFYALISEGYNITDFENYHEEKNAALVPNNLPRESIMVEHFVNLLTTELNSGENPNFIETFVDILKNNALTKPEGLDEKTLGELRKLFQEKISAWKNLLAENHLELNI